jgi:hypothetical protein
MEMIINGRDPIRTIIYNNMSTELSNLISTLPAADRLNAVPITPDPDIFLEVLTGNIMPVIPLGVFRDG